MPTTDLPDWLETGFAALRNGDVDGYVAIYAEDAVHEFPFAPEGRPDRLEGRAVIGQYMAQLPARMQFESFTIVGSRAVGDEVIVEANATGRRLPGGEPFTLDYVWFITHRDGELTHFRDYMNPLQLRSV